MAGGRPTEYRESYVQQVRRLALLGLTDEEVAGVFGVDVRTIYNWDEAHPEFFQARAEGKDDADAKVAERLYLRAMGYEHPDTHVAVSGGEVIMTPITKYYPPDTQAATWWLKNRQKSRWKDTQSLQQLDKDGQPTDPVSEVRVTLVK